MTFASAYWRDLLFLNYRVDAELLVPFLPRRTKLDTWKGSHWLSVVALTFEKLRVLGIPVPFHQDYVQINLRFYVVNKDWSEAGVVFVREIIPKPQLAWGARLVLNEKYLSMDTERSESTTESGARRLTYRFSRSPGRANLAAATIHPLPLPKELAEQARFLTERFSSFTAQPEASVIALPVVHDSWEIVPVSQVKLSLGDPGVFPSVFHVVMARPPDVAFLAAGSPVHFLRPRRVRRFRR